MNAHSGNVVRRDYAVSLALLAIVGLIPVLVDSVYWFGVIIVAMYFVMLSAGWNLQIGFTGQTSLAPAGFAMIGAYTTALLGHYANASPWLGIPAGTLIAGLVGLGLGATVLRLRGTYLALTTLGFAEVAHSVVLNSYEVTFGQDGLPTKALFENRLTWYYVFLAAVVATQTGLFLLLRSPAGLFLQAIRDDEVAARTRGVRTVFWKVTSFTVASAVSGCAGALYAHFAMRANPSIGYIFETGLVMTMVIIGGAGSLVGPLIGALLIYPLTEALRDFGGYHGVLYAVLVIVFARFFRQGLWGFVGLWRKREPPS